MAGYMGPYYKRSAIWREQEQRKALGMQSMGPEAVTAAVRGELEPYYAFQLGEREREQQKAFEERKIGIMEKEAKTAGRAATWSAVGEMAGGAAGLYKSGIIPAIGEGLGLWGGTAGTTAAATAAATAAGEAAVAAGAPVATAIGSGVGAEIAGTTAAAGVGIWETVGTIIASIFSACCWTFLEGEMLTDNVRRYRDEHYDKLSSPISWGYRWMSTWLVPLMRKHKSIKFFVKWIMLKPLANYADWYYGENGYGWLFYPLKVFWTSCWKIAGLIKGGAYQWQTS